MNYNNFGRSRSPAPQPPPPHHLYGYDGQMRPMPNHREFDDHYHPTNPYDRPGRSLAGQMTHSPLPPAHPNQMAPPMALHPYMDVPAHHHNYPPHYREQPPYGTPHIPPPPTSTSYRSAIAHRDTFMSMGPSHSTLPPRSSSPPYKILCVTNINHKISDGPVKDALTSDFSRFGDISVSVCHDNGERLAYIYFRNCEEAREARQIKTRTLLFDKPIEIEPIYEPQPRGSPDNISPTGGPILIPSHSPKRRSISPPLYPRGDPNVLLAPSRRQNTLDVPPTPPGHPPYRGSTPPDYGPGLSGYHHRPSPPSPRSSAPLPPPYDRRVGSYPYPPTQYSSPPHDTSKPAYPIPYPPSGYGRERDATDRMHVSSRSPYRDPYPAEYRGGPPPPPHHQHYPAGPPPPLSSSRSRRRSRSGRRATQAPAADPYRDELNPVRHRYPPDPPARYMSREFRREKFGSDPYPGDHDEGRPSRVLFVNNIDATKTDLDLKELFEPFGTIDEIELKKVASDCSSALVKFTSMDGAYKAKTANNGRHIGATRCRIVYGKVSGSRRLWIGGLSPSMTVPMMEEECGKYGDIVSMDYTSGRPYCYVEYESANQAQFAAFHMRTILTPASERKIRIEFVDPDRSEKLLPRRSSNSQLSDLNLNSKPRTVIESACDVNASPHSSGGLSGRKRSVSPASDRSISKRVCQQNELPLAANTFKQERLMAAAAAAAKARTSSTTSSTASQPPLDRSSIKIGGDTQDSNELNNNSDSNQILVADGNSSDKLLGNETILQEAPSLELLSQCSTMRDVVSCCPVTWPGQIGLRNFIFPALIYMCSGSKQTIDTYLSCPTRDNGPLLRITQRWRLQPHPKLEEVKRRMQSRNLGILIIAARRENPSGDRQVSLVPATVSSDLPPVDGTDETSGQQVALSTCEYYPRNNQLSQNGPIGEEKGDLNNESQQSATTVNETPNTPMDMYEDGAPKLDNLQENSTPPVVNSITTSGDVAAAAERPSARDYAGTPPTPSACTQSRPLRNLISYLEQKDAAGVISLGASSLDSGGGGEQAYLAGVTSELGSASSPKLLYAFPPSDFALNLLKGFAPNLCSGAIKDEFLLGVIVSGNVESGKI